MTAIAHERHVVRDVAYVALKTEEAGGHSHCAYFLADDGNGRTSEADDGHFHHVLGLEVLPARGHTHELSGTRCLERHNERGNHVRPR